MLGMTNSGSRAEQVTGNAGQKGGFDGSTDCIITSGLLCEDTTVSRYVDGLVSPAPIVVAEGVHSVPMILRERPRKSTGF